MNRLAHWIDNADSYICSRCGYECNNPNNERYGASVCPRCLAEMEAENHRKPTNDPMTEQRLGGTG